MSLYGDSTNVRKKGRRRVRVFSKSILVTLSEVKGLCTEDRILRFAQNDRRHDSDFGKALTVGQGLFKVMFES